MVAAPITALSRGLGLTLGDLVTVFVSWPLLAVGFAAIRNAAFSKRLLPPL